MTGPLQGIKIVEVASVITGPWASSLLADQGASVIKVEPPTGDIMRASGHMRGGVGSWFVNLNRGKRAIVVDLTHEKGVEIVRRLATDSDVFVENWRPGVADRLGLGYDHLAELNPDLVYASVTGFGSEGPLAKARAYDPTVQGRSGIVAAQSNDRAEDPQPVRLAISDQVTSMTVCQAITAALLARANGAGGQRLHVSMLEASLQFLWPVGMSDHTFIGDDVTAGIMYGASQRYWATTDGAIMAAVAPDKEWAAFCAETGRDDWLADPRFVDIAARLRNYDELMDTVGAFVATISTDEAEAIFEAADVPYAPAVPRAGIWDDPQVAALGAISEVDHPHLGRIRQTNPPVGFSATPAVAASPAPLLGEQTDEILAELGYAEHEAASLRESGTVG